MAKPSKAPPYFVRIGKRPKQVYLTDAEWKQLEELSEQVDRKSRWTIEQLIKMLLDGAFSIKDVYFYSVKTEGDGNKT